MQAALDAEATAAEADAAEVAAREASQQKTVASVSTAQQMYEERLGLSLVHNTLSGQLEIIFTQVDVAHPLQQFKVAVKILEDDRYEGTYMYIHAYQIDERKSG